MFGSTRNARMIWAAIIGLGLAVAMGTILAGCSGEGGSSAPVTVDATSRPTERPELRIFTPRDSKEIFDIVLSIQDVSSLPYVPVILEGAQMVKGIEGIQAGLFDMMVASRRIEPDEGLVFAPLFSAPAGVYVSADVGVTDLTLEQVIAIFSGEITNWSQVGGTDLEIRVCRQEPDDPMTYSCHEFLFGPWEFSENATIYDSEFDLFFVIETVPGAVMYASRAGELYYEFIKGREFLNPVTLDGLNPEDAGYPFVPTIGYAYLPENQIYLQPFIDWTYDALEMSLVQSLMERFGVYRPDGQEEVPDS